MTSESSTRVLTFKDSLEGKAAFYMALGWGLVAFLATPFSFVRPDLPSLFLALALFIVVVVILLCAMGVVNQAEKLALRLGDPYGTLVLTVSIPVIEVILIAAIMLSPTDNPTIGRDSILSVSHIILNLVIGVSIIIHFLKNGPGEHNVRGAAAYLMMLFVFCAVAFLIPTLIGENGSYTPFQAVCVSIITLIAYAYFLYRQMFKTPDDFREVDESCGLFRCDPEDLPDLLKEHRIELITRVVILLVTVIPIVMLSKEMAVLLDEGIMRLDAPIALSGLLVATIVFTPEALTTFRAAHAGEPQRVVNLCHGALLSTVCISIPAVLVIGLISGQRVVLGAPTVDLALFGLTLLVSSAIFLRKRVGLVWGAVPLGLFAVYLVTLFL